MVFNEAWAHAKVLVLWGSPPYRVITGRSIVVVGKMPLLGESVQWIHGD